MKRDVVGKAARSERANNTCSCGARAWTATKPSSGEEDSVAQTGGCQDSRGDKRVAVAQRRNRCGTPGRASYPASCDQCSGDGSHCPAAAAAAETAASRPALFTLAPAGNGNVIYTSREGLNQEDLQGSGSTYHSRLRSRPQPPPSVCYFHPGQGRMLRVQPGGWHLERPQCSRSHGHHLHRLL